MRNNLFSELSNALNDLAAKEELIQSSREISKMISGSKEQRSLITIFGNGGSAADAQHWAAELVCTYRCKDRKPYPAIALTTDSSILTAWSNDYKFSTCFERQIEAFDGIIGLGIGLSTSGKSANVLSGLDKVRECGGKTILISGNGCPPLAELDLHVRLPSKETPVVQTLTQVLYHYTCELLE